MGHSSPDWSLLPGASAGRGASGTIATVDASLAGASDTRPLKQGRKHAASMMVHKPSLNLDNRFMSRATFIERWSKNEITPRKSIGIKIVLLKYIYT